MSVLPAQPDLTEAAALGSIPAEADVLLRTHAGTQPTHEASVRLATLQDETILELPDCDARVSMTAAGDLVRLTVRLVSGGLDHASFGLRLRFESWSTRWQVLMPAAAYNGNRLDPGGDWRGECVEASGPDPEPQQNAAVPRLELGGGGALQMQAGDMSVPAIGLFDPDARRGCLIWTPQRASGTGVDTVIRLAEDESGAGATLEVLAAGVRQAERSPGRPSRDAGGVFVAGDVVTLELRHASFDATGPDELARRLMASRPTMRTPRPATTTPLLPREVLPFSSVWRMQERKFNEQNWVERHGYYSVGMREAPSQDWQTGWVGGCNTAYALLADGGELTRARACRTFDHLLAGKTPSGFVSDRFDEGRWRVSDRVFLRHQADALYFVSKALMLLRSRGQRLDEQWLALPRGIGDAFCRMWEREGQFGQYADPRTGDVMVGRTCAAGLAPAGLLLAGELLGESRYADVAADAGSYYLERFTANCMTNGGPGDIAQAHDSESAFALLASYTHLYESTRDASWLDAAKDAACQAATYVMPYDFDFPSDSTFGRLGMRTTGTVFANVQNKHSAPGVCTLSGVSLLRLARATGERVWLDLLTDIASAIPQYVSRSDRPIGDVRPGQPWPVMPEGWINERINTSDWEVRGDPNEEIGVGEIFGGSTWSESAMLLTRVEVPGVYVDVDRGWLSCPDHVEASVDGASLWIRNPTPFDARVKVMIDDRASAARPLGPSPLAGQPGVEVPPHGSTRIDLPTADHPA